jgi:hypothetical protein
MFILLTIGAGSGRGDDGISTGPLTVIGTVAIVLLTPLPVSAFTL